MTLQPNNHPRLEIDKQLVARCFAHSRNTYEQEACVQRQVAEKMIQLITNAFASSVQLPQKIVEVGCGTGIFSRLLSERLQPTTFLLNDLCPEMQECLTDLCSEPHIRFQAGDAENLDFPAHTHLIASCSTIQWFHHPSTFLQRCGQALIDDGWLAFSTFGPQNMIQIKQLTGHGLTYFTLNEWIEMLSTDFQIIHAEEEIDELLFDTPLDVLKHMKQTGVTGTEKRMWTRGILQSFCNRYKQLFENPEGKVALTYHPIYLIAKKIQP